MFGKEKKRRTERVIQFGEGGFLRGFCDWMLQIVNEKTDFDGDVVIVQPLEKGMCEKLEAQDCMYTHVIRGVEGVATPTTAFFTKVGSYSVTGMP